MRMLFKQAVFLCGKTYSQGFHEVPESVISDKFFQKMVLSGMISDGELQQPILAETPLQRNQRLAEKLIPKAPPVVLQPEESQEVKEEPKKAKKK